MRKFNKYTLLIGLMLGLLLFSAGCSGTGMSEEISYNSAQQVESAGQQAQKGEQVAPEQDAAKSNRETPGQQKESGSQDNKKQDEKTADNQKEGSNTSNVSDKDSTVLIPATVTYVVDGDTVHVTLTGGKKKKVRFIGVNTPESTEEVEPYGKEASAYTRSRLNGKKVWLEIDVEERDRYGRLLAYIWLSPPREKTDKEIRSKMFNAELLLNGYAQVMTVPPNVKYANYFVVYQKEAREANKGLWGLTDKKGGKAEDYYVASKKGTKFHRPDCEWAQKIAPHNLIKFDSRDEAIDAGYEPCRVCKP